MTLKQAQDILERERQGEESYAECMAEAGMGAVSMGFDGYNGMAEYRMQVTLREQRWAEDHPEEAARYFAEVHTARAVAADFRDLPLYAANEMAALLYLPRIPEYRLNYRKPANFIDPSPPF